MSNNEDTYQYGDYRYGLDNPKPVKRYVSSSERSVTILQGALIYARYMNAPGNDSLREEKDWNDWTKAHHKCLTAAYQLQTDAFDYAMSID